METNTITQPSADELERRILDGDDTVSPEDLAAAHQRDEGQRRKDSLWGSVLARREAKKAEDRRLAAIAAIRAQAGDFDASEAAIVDALDRATEALTAVHLAVAAHNQQAELTARELRSLEPLPEDMYVSASAGGSYSIGRRQVEALDAKRLVSEASELARARADAEAYADDHRSALVAQLTEGRESNRYRKEDNR